MHSPPLSRRRLLLVEDDRMVQETIVLMLEDDYDIQVAVSVSTALAHLRAAEPAVVEVILLDCLLPDGDPADVLAEADHRSIPVVLISGDHRMADAMGLDQLFLPKPFSQATLLEVLDTARG